MSYRKFLIIAVTFLAFEKAYASMSDHIALVTQGCPSSNSLLIKKSLLEMKKSINCNEKFTKQLLKDCVTVDCFHLVESYKKNIQGRSGAVVGE